MFGTRDRFGAHKRRRPGIIVETQKTEPEMTASLHRASLDTSRNQRSRLWLGAGIVLVLALGLASREFPSLFPALLGKYPGDALWAWMVFLGWAWVKPSAATSWLAVLALVTSYAVEFSQLYQAPWINAIRGTTPGHLVFGSAFSWLDLVAYTVGVAVGVGGDVAAARLGELRRGEDSLRN